jgi:ribosome biogenesis GTPase A
VACNKQDLATAKKAIQIEREFQTEFDAIKKVRKATKDQEAETTGGGIGLKQSDRQETIFDHIKGKFSFEQVPEAKVSFVDCSVQANQIDDVYRFLLKLN